MPITTLNIVKPFAENGDRAQIPAFSQNESVSYDEGWTEAYSRLASDRFFNREDINGILYSITIACIINDENMQFVREEASDDRVAIRAEITKGLTDLGNELNAYIAQINLNKDGIKANQDLIDKMQQEIDELVEKVGNGDLDNNLLDPIKQSIILIQERLDELEANETDMQDQLALKADKANVYTKNESDDLFALKADITSIFKYIGAVDNYNSLLAIDPTALKDGYIYLCENNFDEQHPMGFYVYADGAFSRLSGGALSINDKNYAKLDRANLFQVTNKIETPNAQDDNDIMTLGEVKKSIQDYDQNLQIQLGVTTDTITQLRADLTAETNTRTTEATRLANDIKQNAIDIALSKNEITNLDNRVTDLENGAGNVGGGGGTLTPEQLANLAQLNKENTFTKENTFNLGVQIPTAPKDDESAVNKGYVSEELAKQLELVNKTLENYVRLSDVKEVNYFNELPNTANIGETYKVVIGDAQHKAGYYIYNGNEWQFVGSALSDLESAGFAFLTQENTFTEVNTFEADVRLDGGNPKTDNSAVNKKYLDSRLSNLTQDNETKFAKLAGDNLFTANNVFQVTPQITSTIANANDIATKGYVDNEVAKAVTAGGNIDLSGYAKIGETNTFSAQQIFTNQVILQYVDDTPTSQNSAVCKGWVETYVQDELQNLNVDIDTANLAKLDTANTFTETNTFKSVLIANPKTEAEKDTIAENELITKGQLAFLVSSGGGALNPDDLKDYANLTADNSFTKNTIFEGAITKVATNGTTIFDVNDTNVKFDTNPAIENPKNLNQLADNELVTKSAVKEAVLFAKNPNNDSYCFTQEEYDQANVLPNLFYAVYDV